MEFPFIEVGDCNLTIKEFHQRFFPVNFDIGLSDFTSILKAITVLFLLHFDSCPDEAIMIWLTKQMSTPSNKSFRGAFVKCLARKCRKFSRKMSTVEPCFNKVTGQRF